MSIIQSMTARQVLDSRGNPTVEVEVDCADGARGRAIVPSGASTGRHEAVELRDGDPSRYDGKSVGRAVANVREVLGRELIGQPVGDQSGIDRRMIELDGTPNKSRLGANAILGVSLAVAHAAAAARRLPLFEYLAALWAEQQSAVGRRQSAVANHESPSTHGQSATGETSSIRNPESRIRDTPVLSPLTTHHSPLTLPLPMVNMISGGLHAGGNLEFQDFLLLPVGASSYAEALRWAVAVYRSLGRVLAAHGYESALVGDEGGYGPRLGSNREAVDLILDASVSAGLEPGRDVAIALDVASTHFCRENRYHMAATAEDEMSAAELVDLLARWVDAYPIISIEDGCAEDDWDGWQLLTERLGRIQLIGDDLFATNPARLARGIACHAANAILVKPNQIGTLTETLAVLAQAQTAGYRMVVSARSGETEDTTMVHLAIATAAGQIKIGSVARSERLAKYNELLRIGEQLGDRAVFAGRSVLLARADGSR